MSVRCGDLQSSTLKVINAGSLIEKLGTLVEEEVSQWKKNKSKKFTKTDHTFVKEYLEYTSNLLSFFSDLTEFLRAARDRHSNIEYMTSKWTSNMKSDMKSEDFKKILEDLKNLKDSEAYGLSCKNLLTKLRHFKSQQENMSTNLNGQMKLQSEEKTHGSWRNVLTEMLKMSCLIGVLIISIWEVINSPDLGKIAAVGFNVVNVVGAGGALVSEVLNKFKKDEMETLGQVDILVIAELQAIHLLLNEMGAEIDSVLVNVKDATDRGNVGLAMNGMPYKLEKFLEKIVEFEEQLKNCTSRIKAAREKLSTFQFKKKRSCSIM